MQGNLKGRNKRTIDLAACRFCLKVSRNKIQIDDEIKTKYQNLMNEELLENPKLSQNCCKVCVSDLDKCMTVKNKISNNQRFLLELIEWDTTKQEPESEDDFYQTTIKTEFVEKLEEELVEAEDLKLSVPDLDAYQTPSPKSETSDEDFNPESSDLPKKVAQEKNGKLECRDCGKILSKEVGLRKHRARYHPSNEAEMLNFLKKEELIRCDKREKVMCEDCGLELYSYNLPKHQLNVHGHSSIHVFTCDICGTQCVDRTSIWRHMRNKHKDKNTYNCEHCQRVFKAKKNLVQHIITFHENKFSIICDVCGAPFKSKSSYEIHTRSIHTGEKPFTCSICLKSFYSASALNSHLRVSHVKSETCKICNKVYKSSVDLKSHMRNVHEERKFKCTIDGCSRKFATRHKLMNHFHKHADLKKFVCKVCDKPYKNRDGLEKHIRSIHLNLQANCLVSNCQETFHRRDYLRTHIKRKHANLGPVEVQRLVDEAINIKFPSVKPYYKTIMSASDADKFEKFKQDNNLKDSEISRFKGSVD